MSSSVRLRVFMIPRKELSTASACTIDWASERAIYQITNELCRQFGEGLSVEYYDLTKAEVAEEYSEVIQAMNNYKLKPPLIFVNRILKLVGGINYDILAQAIAEAAG